MNPSLEIIHQESVARENFILNGENKDLHLVVKNIPFNIRIGAHNLDLRKCSLSAKLYYDFQDSSLRESSSLREVETLKVSPLDFICHLDPSGTSVDFELKISVLSSAHEGSFFRVKLSALDPEIGTPVECLSAPLRIMSKKSQVMRRVEKKSIIKTENIEAAAPKKRRLNSHEEHSFDTSSSPASGFDLGNNAFSNLSSNIAQLTEAMNRMQQTQLEQAILLKKIMTQQASASSPAHYISSPTSSPTMPLLESNVAAPHPSEDVEQALNHFLSLAKKLSPSERKRKLSQAFDNLSSDKHSIFSEAIGIYTANGYQTPCPPNCPHKQQLDSLELFYSEIMRDPITEHGNHSISSNSPYPLHPMNS